MTIPLTTNTSRIYGDSPGGYAVAVMRRIADNLLAIRTRHANPLTQEQVSALAGVKQAVYSKWETGKADPKAVSLLRLARAFGVSVEEILAGIDEEYDRSRDLTRQTRTGDSLPGGDVTNDTAAADSSRVLEPDEGPMLETIRSVRAAIGESMAKLVDVETRLTATRQATGGKAGRARVRGHR